MEPRRRRRALQDVEQLAHRLEQRHERRVARGDLRIAVGEDRADVGVGHARVAVDDAVVQLVAHDRAAPIDVHHARLHQPVDVRVQAAQAGGEFRRKHVDGAVGEVDRGGALVGLDVERAALGHVVRHVGDVHAEAEAAVLQPLQRDRVVEVARVLAVDRDGELRAEIGPAADVAISHLGAEPLRLVHRLVAVLVGDAELADDDLVVHARLVDVAQHFEDPPERPARGGRPPRDLDDDHVRRLRLGLLARRDLDVHDHPAVERHDETEARRVHVVAPDHSGRTALENPEDAAFGALVADAFDPRDHAVAVHGLIEVAAGDVDVALRRPRAGDRGRRSRTLEGGS